MPSFAGKRLVALALVTAIQILPLRPALAYPIHHAPPQSSNSTSTTSNTGTALEMLTDTEGVNFNSYLNALYFLVRNKWRAGTPPSVEKGDKGIVSIQFRVQQDGKVPSEDLKVVSSSGKKEFDDASLNSIRNVAPFEHLPGKFSRPFIELRMTFYYNVDVPRPR
jgi:TonB family protein